VKFAPRTQKNKIILKIVEVVDINRRAPVKQLFFGGEVCFVTGLYPNAEILYFQIGQFPNFQKNKSKIGTRFSPGNCWRYDIHTALSFLSN
jgi:hypothetical protein